ncbi:MAG: hypothetical protein DCO96_15875 [Fluviicola sp. XM-24bin1]|nr:MAG: hypothetical protein DCO96_15875 [Fluviicola sp. XM-24bin1]
MTKEYIEVLSISALFSGDSKYIIPLYQRNYAWGESQIEQLVQDIFDAALEDNERLRKDPFAAHKVYYLGSLVVFERREGTRVIYETIDGQQRLTTLNILLSVLKNQYPDLLTAAGEADAEPILTFKSRESSERTIETLYKYGAEVRREQLNGQMLQAYEILIRSLGKLKEGELVTFVNYLFNFVRILRIEVPEQTDLNHYFEVMNNRGEQLEKHEILKAKFLNALSFIDDQTNQLTEDSKKARSTFSQIWDACSQMDRYVQYRISNMSARVGIFGPNWSDYPKTFEDASAFLGGSNSDSGQDVNKKEGETKKNSILEIIGRPKVNRPDEVEEHDENLMYFTPVVSFSNFLLHVLRIFTVGDSDIRINVQLDDKKLIQEFDRWIFNLQESDEQKAQRAKDFASTLLRCKYLFDQYIVKRVYRAGRDNWGVIRLQKRDGKNEAYYRSTFGDEEAVKGVNDQLTMILSMFHVSFPQTIYKHWLTGALNYLYRTAESTNEIVAEKYLNYLERMSDAFFYDRFVDREQDYYQIVFENLIREDGNYLVNTQMEKEDVLHNLDIGTKVQNFIFNRLDYRLWLDFDKYRTEIDDLDDEFGDPKIANFEFNFRSSVEHYSPQHPMYDKKPIENLNDFGNLCLISASKNSEVSNYPFKRKREHYREVSLAEGRKIDSLKQLLMMCYANWDEETVKDHQEKMIEVLKIKAN